MELSFITSTIEIIEHFILNKTKKPRLIYYFPKHKPFILKTSKLQVHIQMNLFGRRREGEEGKGEEGRGGERKMFYNSKQNFNNFH